MTGNGKRTTYVWWNSGYFIIVLYPHQWLSMAIHKMMNDDENLNCNIGPSLPLNQIKQYKALERVTGYSLSCSLEHFFPMEGSLSKRNPATY